jgi:hypothetical protein
VLAAVGFQPWALAGNRVVVEEIPVNEESSLLKRKELQQINRPVWSLSMA